jgi:hypothetical protein
VQQQQLQTACQNSPAASSAAHNGAIHYHSPHQSARHVAACSHSEWVYRVHQVMSHNTVGLHVGVPQSSDTAPAPFPTKAPGSCTDTNKLYTVQKKAVFVEPHSKAGSFLSPMQKATHPTQSNMLISSCVRSPVGWLLLLPQI